MILFKQFRVFFFIFLFSILIGCSVNEKTGMLSIENITDKDVNLKIGGTNVFIAKGCVYNYYFYSKIKAVLSADGFEECSFMGRSDVNFKTDFMYKLLLIKFNNKYYIGVEDGVAVGKDRYSDSDLYHNPWFDETHSYH